MEKRFTYRTVKSPSSEVLFKDRGSKFYGYAFPVSSEEDVREAIAMLKKQHFSARHFCYAWYLGQGYERHRSNDDGEPANSAGAPILGQLKAFDVTEVVVVVVRYFGGTKLGVGGLIQAYKQSAREALEAAEIIEVAFETKVRLSFDYSEMNSVMRLVKVENLKIIEQLATDSCIMTISIRDEVLERVLGMLQSMHKIRVDVLD